MLKFEELSKETCKAGSSQLACGNELVWTTDESIGVRVYLSTEVGGGVMVWNPALVSPETLMAAILQEQQLCVWERSRFNKEEGQKDI